MEAVLESKGKCFVAQEYYNKCLAKNQSPFPQNKKSRQHGVVLPVILNCIGEINEQ